MLRKALLGLGIALLLLAAILLLAGSNLVFVLWAAIPGALLAGGVGLERYRYKPIADAPPSDPGWERTGERFIDPESGQAVVVYYNRGSGRRCYARD